MAQKREKTVLPVILACQSEDAQATREFLSRVGDKWSILIIAILSEQPKRRARFSELKNFIHGISQTMLTSTLRALERDGIVERELFPEVPPRVEYELTDFGVSLLEPMRLLVEWVGKNWMKAKRARESFDAKAKTS